MAKFLIILLCLSSIDFGKSCSRDELVMVQFLFRHGLSAPPEVYPTDPNPATVWKEGLDDLTMLGKFRSYALGSLLRSQYQPFITSDPREVDVLSSAHRSCVKSASSVAAALYAPTSEWQIVKGLNWQPMYIEYNPQNMDKYLEILECPAADQEYERILATPEAQAFFSKYQDLFDYWSVHSGWKINNWDSAGVLYDILEIEQMYNLTVPMWAKRYWDEMGFISDMAFHWNLQTKRIQRLRGGPLVDLVVDKMKKKAAGGLKRTKTILYSTHGTNIAAFLTALDLFNGREPPHSATVAIELYEQLNEHYVRFLYLNSTAPEREPQVIHILTLEGCSEFCPLDYIVDYTRTVIPTDWEAECKKLQ